MIREAYEHAAALFVDVVGQIGPTRWDTPALGVWTVRDLVGHTSRALLTVESYLAKAATQRDLPRPVDYFLRVQAGLADPAAVAARGRAAPAATRGRSLRAAQPGAERGGHERRGRPAAARHRLHDSTAEAAVGRINRLTIQAGRHTRVRHQSAHRSRRAP